VPLIERARAGDRLALGQLMMRYRDYLMLLARVQIGRRLQGKADASDLVQETFLAAVGKFEQFQGTSEREWLAWLRQILASRLAKLVRHYCGTLGRDIGLERQLVAEMDDESCRWQPSLVDPEITPSRQAAQHEQAVRLAEALERLPEDYREVLVLRHLEGLTFAEVARRMDRSLDSVDKLWTRALARLRGALGGES
jgi:RNA polymerase sigma-70 factor (ECF subfamily)